MGNKWGNYENMWLTNSQLYVYVAKKKVVVKG